MIAWWESTEYALVTEGRAIIATRSKNTATDRNNPTSLRIVEKLFRATILKIMP